MALSIILLSLQSLRSRIFQVMQVYSSTKPIEIVSIPSYLLSYNGKLISLPRSLTFTGPANPLDLVS